MQPIINTGVNNLLDVVMSRFLMVYRVCLAGSFKMISKAKGFLLPHSAVSGGYGQISEIYDGLVTSGEIFAMRHRLAFSAFGCVENWFEQ